MNLVTSAAAGNASRFACAIAAVVAIAQANTVIAQSPATPDAPAKPGLSITLPTGWTQTLVPGEGGKPGSIVVKAPASPGSVEMKIQLIPIPDGRELNEEAAKKIVDNMAEKAKTLAVDPNFPRVPIAGNFNGEYFTIVSKGQKGPPAGHYHATNAFVFVPNLGLAVSITHRKDSPQLQIALDALKNATYVKP